MYVRYYNLHYTINNNDNSVILVKIKKIKDNPDSDF